MIYSVNSKSWKVLEDTFSSDSLEGWHSGVLINNHLLHWRFWSPTKRKRRIGCFDVCSEQWNEDVLLPPYYYDPTHQNYLLDIGVLHGSLFSSFENRVDSCYDVWVMREYADQQSWLKLLSITISDDLVLHGGVVPVACCRPGSSKVLLRQRNKARLFWYDKEDNAINNAEVPCLWEHEPYICNGSLVTLPDLYA
ncbi:F-box protein At4g22390-like [Silene latifolia]|uniref:F-box protein At4g22390-like n=1 Tax=Silene latifolia TaxID=37657 RepID=UPI003D775C75